MDIVSRLAASVLTSQNLWPHVEFLYLMHVLEGFHRSLCGGGGRLERRLNDLAKNLSEVVRKRIFGNEDGQFHDSGLILAIFTVTGIQDRNRKPQLHRRLAIEAPEAFA